MSGIPTPRREWTVTGDPREFPGLVCMWDFASRDDDGRYTAAHGQRYRLVERAGPMSIVDDPDAPHGGRALQIDEGQWLSIPRRQCPALDFHGPGEASCFTLVAWIQRGRLSQRGCEFIAGQWNETRCSRQYGLFLNIGTWGGADQICGHLSTTGGPTPGYRYCFDGPIGATCIDHERYHCIAMSYDGQHGYAWLDGRLDAQPTLNPYLLPGGLNDGGPDGSDFTVGAVDRSGEVGNFFAGRIAALAVYHRVLSPAEIWALAVSPG
jgi:hypothetical protein